MFKVYKRLSLLLTIVFTAIMLVACGNGSEPVETIDLEQLIELVEIDLNGNSDLANIDGDLILPTMIEGYEEVLVTWISNNEDALLPSGEVFRIEEENVEVVLTLHLSFEDKEASKLFDLIILALPEVVEPPLTEEEIRELIQEDIDALETLEIVNFKVNTPNIGSVNGSTITWAFSGMNVSNSGVVIASDVIANKAISATGYFNHSGIRVSKKYDLTAPNNENTIINEVKTVSFENKTTEYVVESEALNIYTQTGGSVPYVSLSEFVNFLKGLVDPNLEFVLTNDDGVYELQYNYLDEENDEIYELILTADTNTNKLLTNDSGYFYGYTVRTETNYGRNINYLSDHEWYHYLGSEGFDLDLGRYGFSVIDYNDEVLIPFYVANLLFANSNYYSVYYNQDILYGLYFGPNSTNERKEIMNSSVSGDVVPVDLLVHNYNFMAFFFDNFYGLKDYKEVKTYYTVLQSQKNSLLNGNASLVDNAIYTFVNKSIDELHTSFNTKSYYNQIGTTPTFSLGISDLGPNSLAFYLTNMNGVDGAIGKKWNVPSSWQQYNAYHSNREYYWTIEDEILVISLDGFDTADIEERSVWDNEVLNKILNISGDDSLLPAFTTGDRFIYFNTSEDDLKLSEVLIKGVSQAEVELFKDQLALIGNYYNQEEDLETPLYKTEGYYTLIKDEVEYMVQVHYDEEFEVMYLGVGNQTPENFESEWPYYYDVESLILSDSAIYLEFYIEKALRETPTINRAILDITWNTGGNVGALYRVIGMLYNENFRVSNFDPTLGEEATRVINVNSPVSFENLNWTLLTSSISYSAANMMPTIVKSNNLGIIAGQRSFGGAASVTPVYLPVGTIIQASSSNVSAYVVGDNTEESPYEYIINEGGIIPDFMLSANNLYNEELLAEIVRNNT